MEFSSGLQSRSIDPSHLIADAKLNHSAKEFVQCHSRDILDEENGPLMCISRFGLWVLQKCLRMYTTLVNEILALTLVHSDFYNVFVRNSVLNLSTTTPL